MSIRGEPRSQLPPIGTNQVDPAGIAAITDWIEHMTTDRGYPKPRPDRTSVLQLPA